MAGKWLFLAPGIVLLAACTAGGSSTDPGQSARPAVTSQETTPSTTPTLPSKSLPVAAKPTPGANVSLGNAPLDAGDGISVGLHPTEAPITFRAVATMPLTVCPDDDSAVGTGLSWPLRRFTQCFLIPQDEWVQMPSSHTNSFHLGFRIVAPRSGTLRSLTISYQRVDTFFVLVTNSSTMTAMTTTFTPAGNSAAAAAMIYNNNNQTAPPDAVALTQAGSSRPTTGACTFLTEATSCFRDLSAGQPATVRVLHVSDSRAVALYLSWP